MSTQIKLSKTEISKIVKSEGLLGSLLSKIACPLIKLAVPWVKMFQLHQEYQLQLQKLMHEFKRKYMVLEQLL